MGVGLCDAPTPRPRPTLLHPKHLLTTGTEARGAVGHCAARRSGVERPVGERATRRDPRDQRGVHDPWSGHLRGEAWLHLAQAERGGGQADSLQIAPDGHCMFNAIADQLVALQLISPDQAADPKFTRRAAVDYMRAHPDDFMPFLPSITGEDSAGATEHDGMMTPAEFEKYCTLVAETGEWGGEPEVSTGGIPALKTLFVFSCLLVRKQTHPPPDPSTVARVPNTHSCHPARPAHRRLAWRTRRYRRRRPYRRGLGLSRRPRRQDQLPQAHVRPWRGTSRLHGLVVYDHEAYNSITTRSGRPPRAGKGFCRDSGQNES